MPEDYALSVSTVSFEWHEKLATHMIANPGCSLADLCVVFQKTAQWISHIRNTDAFKEYYSKRSDMHFASVSADLREKVEVVGELALDEIAERIVDEDVEMGVDTLTNIAEMSMKALGFGSKPASGVHIGDKYELVVGDPEALARARENMKEVKTKILDAEIQEGKLEIIDEPEPQTALPAPD